MNEIIHRTRNCSFRYVGGSAFEYFVRNKMSGSLGAEVRLDMQWLQLEDEVMISLGTTASQNGDGNRRLSTARFYSEKWRTGKANWERD